MKIKLDDIDITDMVQRTLDENFPGWERLDPLSKQELRRSVIDIIVPTIPLFIHQVGSHVFREAFRVAAGDSFAGLYASYNPTPYDTVEA